MKYIIFDFNGTILDDVAVGVKCINILIKKYLDRPLLTKEEYRELFDFPVIDYYRHVGFDFEKYSFKDIGREWMDHYENSKDEYHLVDGVKEILEDNLKRGYINVILSASERNALIKQCQELGIVQYFETILGIDNIYAGSKEGIAKAWIADKNPDECFFIGDTSHDLAVAQAMGVKCALVAKGHQSKARLKEYTDNVYDDIREVEYV